MITAKDLKHIISNLAIMGKYPKGKSITAVHSPDLDEFFELFAEEINNREAYLQEKLLKITTGEMTLKKLDSVGDLMTLDEWIGDVECGGFIDYDGWGYYCTETEQSNISVSPSDLQAGLVTKVRERHPELTHVMWYNR